jgi:molybdopterin-containing oxidoreductase family iron-sulfur binding subunit
MSVPPKRLLDLDALRAALGDSTGREAWRRLEDLAREPALHEALRAAFPSQTARFQSEVERRDFLRLMGASMALAGLGACTRQPEEKIVPFARQPESIVPGVPRAFATAMLHDGAAIGLLVESHMGRPTKVEGNPDHPGSLGSTDGFAQAAILGLYDPDRSRSVLRAGQISTWERCYDELKKRLDELARFNGEGLRVLIGEVLSPTLAGSLARLQKEFPRARVHRWTPVHRDHERAGALLAFGRDVSTRYRFDRADVVLALDADFLTSGPGHVRHARDFSARRLGRRDSTGMNRLYAVESTPTITGAMADHRWALRPSEVEAFAREVARELGIRCEGGRLGAESARAAKAVARDLASHSGAALVIPGREQPPAVHALAHAMNHALGSAGEGRTVEHQGPLDPVDVEFGASLRELVDDMAVGRVSMLVVLGGNPVYDAPADLRFAEALQKVGLHVHLGLYEDETAALAHWHVPEAHFLEAWGDARAHDGTASIVQPLIAPLYGGRSAIEMLSTLAGEPRASAYELVRATRMEALGLADTAFEEAWARALHDGLVAGSAFRALDVKPARELRLAPARTDAPALELALRPDASVFDGRFANNGWLQEAPRPLTRLVWDNAALLSPATAARIGVENGDVIELASEERRLRAPVWIDPGQADECIGLHLGYGRARGGRLAAGVGVDAYRLRTTSNPWHFAGVHAERTGERAELVTLQMHASQEGRELARVATFDRFAKEGAEVWRAQNERAPADLSLYPDHEYSGYAWGMVIDLNACIGCNACMIACQSENNVPIVGKEQCANGREMHWIRIDRYYDTEGADVVHQPVPCMHCERAPCEVVCPVAATVHSDEGLNEMVYNRCVGTRYCANNCPYKVRRFNFQSYSDTTTESLKLGNNPDVTIRSRGVMEKCSYCVQRINQARIQAKKEDRVLRDGEVVSACQAVCPTQAIVFGDVNDPSSAVSRLRSEPHHYALLAELGTRPRTTYLAKLTHPNPELGGA